eukprot:875594-Pelagomonas_calceolata.AAC.7
MQVRAIADWLEVAKMRSSLTKNLLGYSDRVSCWDVIGYEGSFGRSAGRERMQMCQTLSPFFVRLLPNIKACWCRVSFKACWCREEFKKRQGECPGVLEQGDCQGMQAH